VCHLLPMYHAYNKKDEATNGMRLLHVVTLSYFIIHLLLETFYKNRVRNTSFGIATRYRLDRPEIESRPWSPPSLPYNGYRVSFPRAKRPGRDSDLSPICVCLARNRTAFVQRFASKQTAQALSF